MKKSLKTEGNALQIISIGQRPMNVGVRRNFKFRPTNWWAIALILIFAAGVQSCKDDEKPELALSGITDNALIFAAAGEAKTFDIASNVEWSITKNAEATWLTIAPPSGKGNQKVTATATANTATDPRNATVTITVKDLPPATVTVTQQGAKTVAVGTQVGALTAGAAGEVTFAVTTANIAAGTHTPTVANLPAGITAANVAIAANGSGTLTLSGTAAAEATISNLALTIDGATSAAFTLTISPAAPATPTTKIVALGAQEGRIRTGETGSVTFPVTTLNIADGQAGTVYLFNSPTDRNPITNLPPAIMSATVSNVSNNAATVTITFNVPPARAGTQYIRVRIDGVTSNMESLNVSPPAGTDKTIEVGEQSLPMTHGRSTIVGFPVITNGIADGDYTPIVQNLPAGVNIRGGDRFRITDGVGTLFLQNHATNALADTYDMFLTFDGATPAPFTLVIDAPAPPTNTVTVGAATESVMKRGVISSAVLPVTISGFTLPVGVHTPVIENMPDGTWYNMITVSDEAGVNLLLLGIPSVAGTFSNLTLTINGATSPPFTIVIDN